MNNINSSSTVQTSADPAPAVPAALPGAIVAQLRAIRDLIPEYQQLPASERKSLAVVAKGTDPEFVQASINTVGASSNVQQALGRQPEDLRSDTMDAQSWTAVEDELRAMLAGVAAGNLLRYFRIGQAALATYAIAGRLVQQKEHANLLTHVETMKRLNRFGRKRAKTATPSTPQAPTAQPPVTTAPATTPTASQAPEPHESKPQS